MLDVEFFNLYVEHTVNEVVELTKTRLLTEAQLTFQEKGNCALRGEIENLKKQIEELNVELAKKGNQVAELLSKLMAANATPPATVEKETKKQPLKRSAPVDDTFY